MRVCITKELATGNRAPICGVVKSGRAHSQACVSLTPSFMGVRLRHRGLLLQPFLRVSSLPTLPILNHAADPPALTTDSTPDTGHSTISALL